MTVNELIQALLQIEQPDLDVNVPCPHCCGEPGPDFCMLDADHCLSIEQQGLHVLLLGDPGRRCLDHKRADSRRSGRKAVRSRGQAMDDGLRTDMRVVQHELL